MCMLYFLNALFRSRRTLIALFNMIEKIEVVFRGSVRIRVNEVTSWDKISFFLLVAPLGGGKDLDLSPKKFDYRTFGSKYCDLSIYAGEGRYHCQHVSISRKREPLGLNDELCSPLTGRQLDHIIWTLLEPTWCEQWLLGDLLPRRKAVSLKSEIDTRIIVKEDLFILNQVRSSRNKLQTLKQTALLQNVGKVLEDNFM